MKKTVISVGFVVLIIGTICSMSFAKTFSDLSNTHWAYRYVNELSDKYIISGYQDGTFKPSNTVTKAEYIKLLDACVQQELERETMRRSTVFYDKWFEPYYEYARDKAHLDTEFSTEELIQNTTREEMANVLASFVRYIRDYYDYQENVTNSNSQFSDIDSLDNNSKENILYCAKLGLINGYEDGTFKPYNTMTRAEVSKIIYIYNQMVESVIPRFEIADI